MGALRWIAAAGVLVLSAYCLYALVLLPYRCNHTKRDLQLVAIRNLERPDGIRVAPASRRALADLDGCIRACPTDPDVYMTAAAHYRRIGRWPDAAAMYREALEYDRRPELFFNLGMVQLEMNEREAATDSFITASRFNDRYTSAIPDRPIRSAVVQAIQERRDHLGAPPRTD